MNSNDLREQFISVLKEEFPLVQFNKMTLKSGKVRISVYVPNQFKDKRWMQLDANDNHLSIAMNHFAGDIRLEDIKSLNLQIGLNGYQTAITLRKNNDAVNISIFEKEAFDFSNEEFIEFLHKHFRSYMKLVKKIQN